jgi:hypothetical protein
MDVNGQLYVPSALPTGKQSLYLSDGRLSGPQNRSGRYGEEKNPLLLPGIEPRLLRCETLTDVVDKNKSSVTDPGYLFWNIRVNFEYESWINKIKEMLRY